MKGVGGGNVYQLLRGGRARGYFALLEFDSLGSTDCPNAMMSFYCKMWGSWI